MIRPIHLLLLSAVAINAPVLAWDLSRDAIPRRWIEPFIPEDLPPLEYPAYFNDIDKARAQIFAGRYKLGLQTLRGIEDTETDPVDLALLRADALAAIGRKTDALEALASDAVVEHPAVEVRRARILADMGQTHEAIRLLQAHLAKHPDSLEARYRLGEINERIGNLDAARTAYDWFVNAQGFLEKWEGGAHPAFENAADVVTIARAFDRWASLSGAYRDNPRLNNLIFNMFVRAYDVIDRAYWPAHTAAAEYLMSHDAAAEALKELQAALERNPNDARTLELLGLISLNRFDFDRVDAIVLSMRRVDPDSIEARILAARNLLLQRRPHDAEHPIAQVLAIQPDHLEALGLRAATFALQLRHEETRQVLAEVEKRDPDNASAYLEVAEQLGAMRQYPRSADMYKIAIERAPWWTAARNGLGLLYTQSGDEDDAYTVLEAARLLDPFNHRTTNYLRLLDDLRRFARRESEHFIVMHDPDADPIIADYFSEYLESVHAEICEVFQHEPEVKTLIEIFPTHDAFSVRTTGSPWIGTVGASTGRVIAMVSPRKGGATMGTYNWAQVLRHEYVHTVTLSATDNRITHWMTEGLAVLEERAPLRWEWIPMLHHAVTRDELFTLDNITWGFIRPRRPIDRSLAYAQSYWICKYIQETYGHDAILLMLRRFREGGRQDQVFMEATGRSPSEFHEEFKAWAERQVAGWGYDPQTSAAYEALRDEAEELVRTRRYAEAIERWKRLAALRPVDALPHVRLAGLYLTSEINDPLKAIEHLTVLHKVEMKDNRYAKRIARLHRDMNRLDDAIRFAMESVHVDPYDLSAHQLLAELYEKSGDAEKLARERRTIEALQQLKANSKN